MAEDTPDSLSLEPVQIKSATIYALRLLLHSSDLESITQFLEEKMQVSAAYYEDEPIVIDATALPEGSRSLAWKPLVKLLTKYGFTVLGFTAPESMATAARKAGLIAIDLPAYESKPLMETLEVSPVVEMSMVPTATETLPTEEPLVPSDVPEIAPISAIAPLYPSSTVIDKPLRSGQKVYAKGGDLIVLGMVSHGAEVIADGNIYVFGPLRGRAMAGASGQEGCKIFATQFNAELIAVAGIYRSLTEVPEHLRNKPTWVQLKDNKLLLEPFTF